MTTRIVIVEPIMNITIGDLERANIYHNIVERYSLFPIDKIMDEAEQKYPDYTEYDIYDLPIDILDDAQFYRNKFMNCAFKKN